MILVDTSAWTEYLRGTGSGAHFRLRELLAADAVLGTTDVVHMELLAGSRTETDDLQLRRMLAAMDHVPVDPVDWETAARLHRTCERSGESVYSLTDCDPETKYYGREVSRVILVLRGALKDLRKLRDDYRVKP